MVYEIKYKCNIPMSANTTEKELVSCSYWLSARQQPIRTEHKLRL